MPNQSTTHNQSAAPMTRLAFPPLPLASGDLHTDIDGAERLVTAVTVLVSLEGRSEPVEMSLENKFGGWWAPAENAFQHTQSRQPTEGTGR